MAANPPEIIKKSHNSLSICHKDIILGSTPRFISTMNLLEGPAMWFGHCITIKVP